MLTATSLIAAAISAVVSLVVFVLSQFWTGRRERDARTFERRRAALIDVQDAALELRNALARFGPLAREASGGSPGGALGEAQARVDDAFARLDVRLTRLDDTDVSDRTVSWRDKARFHYVSLEEVTTASEKDAWNAMNSAIGTALTSAATGLAPRS